MNAKVVAFLLVVATICAEIPLSNGYQWIHFPDSLLDVVFGPNNKTVTMKWEWKLSASDIFSDFKIKRYKMKMSQEDLTTTKVIAYFLAVNPTSKADSNYFNFVFDKGSPGGSNGKAKFTIKDITNQGTNKDSTPVQVLADDYFYKCEVNIAQPDLKLEVKITKLVVNKKPSITSQLKNRDISESNKRVALKCTADGKPSPDITWEITRSGDIKYPSEDEQVMNPFRKEDVGIYKCLAKNAYGSDTIEVLLQYTACDSGCTSDSEIAIEMTKLTYSDGYDNSDSVNYKTMKRTIEKECMLLYIKQANPKIYSCLLTGFRKGSVIALVTLNYPTGTADPRKPLRTAIETGKFAGQDVKTSFVSPTSPPTEKPPSTLKPTNGPGQETPDAGQRGTDGGGLSSGAIIAIVVVFSIIFVVIIVVLIVCMLKRKKPADSRKEYKEDGEYNKPAGSPLKSQPYREDPHDNTNDDRYPNGGGPPPQYTPSSNYAEVRPNAEDQDESQVEWDTSVKNKDEMWI